ncbi:MAG: aminotransferase, syn family [Candidatus Brocadiaceae bacterium]|nr:aminotransferase, syn family [Candidatus Brocadiaceae bacterium]
MVRPDSIKNLNGSFAYCGSLGYGFLEVISSLISRKLDIPSWPQLNGERRFNTYYGRVAIDLLCRMWKICKTDEVLLPAYNCGSEVSPFVINGCRVVFFRVDKKARIDFDDIQKRATTRTRLVYVTHYFGWPQDLREISLWCRDRNILLVEDCAHALFSNSGEQPLGTIGDASIFSFRKFLPVPDGGALIIKNSKKDDSNALLREPSILKTVRGFAPFLKINCIRKSEKIGLYSILRKLSLFRNKKDTSELKISSDLPDMPSSYYFEPAIKDLSISSASISLLNKANPLDIIKRRRQNYLQLLDAIRDIEGVEPLHNELQPGVCPMGFPLLVKGRGVLTRILNRLGIDAFAFWKGYHQGFSWDEFPESRYLKDNLLVLPIHQALGPVHVQFIAKCLRAVMSGSHLEQQI